MTKILFRVGNNDQWQEKEVKNEELADELLYLFETGYTVKSKE